MENKGVHLGVFGSLLLVCASRSSFVVITPTQTHVPTKLCRFSAKIPPNGKRVAAFQEQMKVHFIVHIDMFGWHPKFAPGVESLDSSPTLWITR